MMMGDMLAAARDRSGAFEAWIESADPALADRMKRAATLTGLTPTGYVRAAVAAFGRYAAEEDWATLTSSLRDSDDPGAACLLAMVHWRLSVGACQSHSHSTHQHEGASP
jgi:phytoene dehydrogenase-like protein